MASVKTKSPLITFLNDVINKPRVTSAFMQSPQAVMADYGLTTADEQAILKSGQAGKCLPQDAQAIVDLIIPELMSNYNKVW